MRGIMKKGLACALAVTVVFSGITLSHKNVERVQAADTYELVWSDEFDENVLNRQNWNVEVNGDGGGNQEHQYYVDRLDNISVSDGTLKITVLKKSYNGKQYTSGRINSKSRVEVKYGRIEARMKLPSFQGAWPAFWMLGANYSSVGWPKCGEIDIMEAINTEAFTNGAVHWDANGQADEGRDSRSIVGNGFDRTQWHTYAIEWNEATIQWFVDDKCFYTQDISASHMSEFREKQFIIFNFAVGGSWPGHIIDDTAIPATMEVDYVRVYQKASDGGSISGSAIPEGPTVEVPTKIEYKNTLEGKDTWEPYFGFDWAGATGSGSSTRSDSYTLNINSVGNNQWGIQASMKGIDYTPGNTYKYSFTMVSDITKKVIVKVVGEDSEYDIFSMDYITLNAGEPYYYSKDITIPSYYKGRLDLFFGMGGGVGGEVIPSNTKAAITMADASFAGEVSIPIEIPTQEQEDKEDIVTENITTGIEKDEDTTIKTDEDPVTTEGGAISTTTVGKDIDKTTTNEKVTTSINGVTNVKKPAKAKVKYAKKKKTAKKVKISLRRIKRADGYVVKISASQKFTKKKTIKKITKKTMFSVGKLKKNKKYYVKARAYIKNGSKKIYGKWSKVKKVK